MLRAEEQVLQLDIDADQPFAIDVDADFQYEVSTTVVEEDKPRGIRQRIAALRKGPVRVDQDEDTEKPAPPFSLRGVKLQIPRGESCLDQADNRIPCVRGRTCRYRKDCATQRPDQFSAQNERIRQIQRRDLLW